MGIAGFDCLIFQESTQFYIDSRREQLYERREETPTAET